MYPSTDKNIYTLFEKLKNNKVNTEQSNENESKKTLTFVAGLR